MSCPCAPQSHNGPLVLLFSYILFFLNVWNYDDTICLFFCYFVFFVLAVFGLAFGSETFLCFTRPCVVFVSLWCSLCSFSQPCSVSRLCPCFPLCPAPFHPLHYPLHTQLLFLRVFVHLVRIQTLS